VAQKDVTKLNKIERYKGIFRREMPGGKNKKASIGRLSLLISERAY
jgi:hypothetical protein